MSVIHYAHDELTAMAATCWNRGSIGSTDNLRYMERMAEGVTLISKANTDAYNATYTRDEVTAEHSVITARDIKMGIVGQTIDARRMGIRTLEGIRYNLVANDGQDFATVQILDWLLNFMEAARRRASMGYDKAVAA